MRHETATIAGRRVTIHSLDTVVVGSGAAGLNAADRLHAFGVTDIAIVTEGMAMGTSRNTGSDKQTYYKLTLAGGEPDSVRAMAETLFSGGAMHGDIAIVEAALSARCFYRLVEIGVPFPQDRYGEYVGYKTDHDPRQRATSAGPLTSRFMTERLEEEVKRRGIPVFDHHQVIGILTDADGKNAVGLVALDCANLTDPDRRYVVFDCANIVYAVGGPAGMYGASAYPSSQSGGTGIALAAGAVAHNLTESQFGIASIGFRWNLSGTYQQAIPRYISTDADGGDEREFLDDCFSSTGAMLDAVFLKGYQWPFDSSKIADGGSSLVDLLVRNERTVKKRRVFLDYRFNPARADIAGRLDISLLGGEARVYLEKSGGLAGRSPLDRLVAMNRPAYELFRDNGIDLERTPLEIAVCNQHANGGLAGDIWWESTLKHFFPVGEVNGSHGVRRPGGSALNAGQAGGLRAAMRITAYERRGETGLSDLICSHGAGIEAVIDRGERFAASIGSLSTVTAIRERLRERMDVCGGIVRSASGAEAGVRETQAALDRLLEDTCLASIDELPDAFRNYDLLVCQHAYLAAIADFIERGGKSRGSFLVNDPSGVLPAEGLSDDFRFSLDDGAREKQIQTIMRDGGSWSISWEPVRPLPPDDCWFETVWKEYRAGGAF